MALDQVDQVDQAIISQTLIAAAKEMGIKLVRSAYSPIVREANDCSAALLDVEGNVVSQAELIPMQLGPIGTTFRPCAELFPPETLEPGDFYINNDPYHGGQHVPDVFIFSPIFFGGRLVGFSATVAHHLDLGGGAPGLNMAAGEGRQARDEHRRRRGLRRSVPPLAGAIRFGLREQRGIQAGS